MTYSHIVRFIVSVSLILTFGFGILGNILVCSAVHRNKSMRTVTNLILVNLAIADLLGCVVNMPIMFVTFITDFAYLELLGGVHFVLTVFIGIAICSCQILLCIDRHDVMKSPSTRKITRYRMQRVTKILWSVSIGAGLVTCLLVIFVPTHWLTLHDEQPHFIAGEILNGFGTIVILAILVSMLYSCYAVKRGILAHNTRMMQSLGRATLDREIKINKVAACLVIGFTATCLPWIIVRLLYSITGHQDKVSYIASYTLLYASHAINPIVYAGFMKTFQKAMLQSMSLCILGLFCQKSPCCMKINPHGNQVETSTNTRLEHLGVPC